jgi:hypothetical protein
MRKPNNAADKHEQYGELGIHQSASFKTARSAGAYRIARTIPKLKMM